MAVQNKNIELIEILLSNESVDINAIHIQIIFLNEIPKKLNCFNAILIKLFFFNKVSILNHSYHLQSTIFDDILKSKINFISIK